MQKKGSSCLIRAILLLVLSGLFQIESQSFAQDGESPVYTRMIDQMDSVLTVYNHNYKLPYLNEGTERKYGFQPWEVPTYPSGVYKQRLKEIPSVFSMDYNHKVQTFIDLYTRNKRHLTSRLLGRAPTYFPIIEEVFDREGLPLELKYLAVIESAFNNKAVSPAAATGLWQFMLPTGKMYGLRIDSYVDERCDPYKSTVAAARYLKDLYKMFGDWQLAIAAYNCGPGRLAQAIKMARGKKNFWDLWRFLPSETASYVPAFIGATYAMHYAPEHNIYPTVEYINFKTDTTTFYKQKVSFAEIARTTGCTIEELRILNPELRLDVVPYSSKPYSVRVPDQVAFYFRTNGKQMFDKVPAFDPFDLSDKKVITHQVKRGDTPELIAQKYNVPVDALREWNRIHGPHVHTWQRLRIYVPMEFDISKIQEPAPVAPAVNANPAPTTAAVDDPTKVKEGEKPETKTVTLAPGASTPVATAPKPQGYAAANHRAPNIIYHRVRSGDTLWTIAQRYGKLGSIDQIAAMNNMNRNAILRPGQVLKVGHN
jgi:membrane-bound lytic murein transglycosylase D